MDADGGRGGEARVALTDAAGAMLCDPRWRERLRVDWFSPAAWGAAARPVAEGGRGAAWFVAVDDAHWVLRHYRRGGLVARLSRDRYLWRGEPAVRSFAEFRLLQRLRAIGLPVPAPVAACYRRGLLTYEADLIVERIPSAKPLAACLRQPGDEAPWREAGRAVARMHRARVEHADLNANNILLADGRAWLIDFDRGRFRDAPGDWQQRNLARLQRSLGKLGGAAADAAWRPGFAALCAAYDEEMSR